MPFKFPYKKRTKMPRHQPEPEVPIDELTRRKWASTTDIDRAKNRKKEYDRKLKEASED